MIVLCTGPESSGTRLLTRLVAGLGVEAVHRSIPHGGKWWDAPRFDRAIFISRDPWITEISAKEAGHPDNGMWTGKEKEFPYRLTRAWREFSAHVIILNRPWIPITYEGLLKNAQWTMDNIADWLEVKRAVLPEPVTDPRPLRHDDV